MSIDPTAAPPAHLTSTSYLVLGLIELGLLTEEREAGGRRRRLFTITVRGGAAIRAWLATPAREPTELRDAGLLQLFFADLGSTDDRRALAIAQLAIHRAALARYEDDRRGDRGLNGSDPAARTVEHWRGVTLPMGLLYERAAVEFWEGVAAGARVEDAAADRRRAVDDGARLVPGRAWRDVGGER